MERYRRRCVLHALTRAGVLQRIRAGEMAHAVRPREGLEQFPNCVVPGNSAAVGLLSIGRRLIHYGYARCTFSVSVYPAESLHHAFPRDEIADHVIGIHVDADFAGRRRNQKDGNAEVGNTAGHQSVFHQLASSFVTLADAPGTNEQNHHRRRFLGFRTPAKAHCDSLRRIATIAEYGDTRRSSE